MPSCKPVLFDHGAVEGDVLNPLIAAVQAIPPDRWRLRMDPESDTTKKIRQHLPQAVELVLEWIAQHLLVPGTWNRVVLSMVPAGCRIWPHTDQFGEEIRSKSIHCHLPLTTHPSVTLGFPGYGDFHLPVGQVHRMDESYTHQVDNPSTVDRIHLLFAFFPHEPQWLATL